MGLNLPDKITQLHRLPPLHHRQDHIFPVVGKGTLRLKNRSTPVQVHMDELTDWLRVVTDNRKVLAQIYILNGRVYHQRLCHQAAKGEHPRLDVKYEESCHRNG